MKLAYYQIKHIEDYVNSQRLHYNDIRQELTDHIASSVEHKIEQDQVSFSEAFSEAIQEINCFGIQKKKLINETISIWKGIITNSLQLLQGYRLLLLVTISVLTSYLYSNSTDISRLDDWFSTILKIVIVLPVIVAMLDRKQKPYRFSYFMTSVVGLYLLVEIITASKIFIIDNMIVSNPVAQIVYFSLCFFVALTGYDLVYKTYQRVKKHAIH